MKSSQVCDATITIHVSRLKEFLIFIIESFHVTTSIFVTFSRQNFAASRTSWEGLPQMTPCSHSTFQISSSFEVFNFFLKECSDIYYKFWKRFIVVCSQMFLSKLSIVTFRECFFSAEQNCKS